MSRLFKNIRFYVLSSSILLSILIFIQTRATVPGGSLQIIRLTQYFALISLFYLYLAILAGPFIYTFHGFPFRRQYFKARRALGVSAFYFGLLHACFAFFGQLGGFAGLAFLSEKYLLAISLSFTALVILTAMAATSFDFMVRKLGSRWKMIHRFVYLAGFFILIHALMLGTHFSDLSTLIPKIFFTAFAFLIILEGRRVDAFLSKKFKNLPSFGIIILLVAGFIITGTSYYAYTTYFPQNGGIISLGIHAQHIQLAKEAQQGNISGGASVNNSNIPGFKGDKTKRYTVSFSYPENIQANQDVELRFKIYDASSGNKVDYFSKIWDKSMHLIVVDSGLKYYDHIHPVLDDDGFTIVTQFPKDGIYHLYINFQPFGAIEQQFAFTLPVGDIFQTEKANNPLDGNLTKFVDDYRITLITPLPLVASQLSVGQQKLTFNIEDAKTEKPVKTLKPYLGAFGHLVLINQTTYDYIHVHPTTLNPPAPNANSGPNVEFLPLGLYGPIEPGVYRIFVQFNPDNKLTLVDYTVKIQ